MIPVRGLNNLKCSNKNKRPRWEAMLSPMAFGMDAEDLSDGFVFRENNGHSLNWYQPKNSISRTPGRKNRVLFIRQVLECRENIRAEN